MLLALREAPPPPNPPPSRRREGEGRKSFRLVTHYPSLSGCGTADRIVADFAAPCGDKPKSGSDSPALNQSCQKSMDVS